jgi:hypothetical protein
MGTIVPGTIAFDSLTRRRENRHPAASRIDEIATPPAQANTIHCVQMTLAAVCEAERPAVEKLSAMDCRS